MKRSILLIALLLLVFCLGVVNVSCDPRSKYVGMYYAAGSSEGAWLELRADGTFQGILGWSGRWEVEGNQLTLIHALGLEKWIIDDGKISTQSGRLLYVKQ